MQPVPNQAANDLLKAARDVLQPRKPGRFILVGLLNTGVGLAVFPFLYLLFSGYCPLNGLIAISQLTCGVFGYVTHRKITFVSRRAWRHELPRYVLLSLVIYGINVAIMNTVPTATGAHPIIVQTLLTLVITGVLAILNFLGLKGYVFR